MPHNSPPNDTELDRLVAVAEAACDAAGRVIRPAFRAGLPATRKADRSPVTDADRSAEQAMRAVIAAACPEDGLLGEEFGAERPEAPRRWVIDPIDGTRAFITGRPVFGTLIALLEGETPIIGVIDQPVTEERWVGVAGRTTRFRGPFGGVAGARACLTLDRAELSCTSPEMFEAADWARWSLLAGTVARASFGGDCYAYGLLALGQIDVIAEADLKIWDWAALLPVIEGAGGRMTDWTGAALRADGDGRAVAVGDPRLLAPVVALLSGGGI
jgi:histidinol phosphatase-like enzyme (inositol monophosphatase family)